ncbi:hypothetical protein Fmac_026612 [Flemingia macrophylla]|uniref:Mono-/di-acylglycerol lipase N-terminal domain-containing protein n=1 Tax=Flemingia macrophylla TaxID=520843 RepID=A0ABD1LFY1_9FABA
METISTLSETLRFTYSETLGKWPIGDLAFGGYSLGNFSCELILPLCWQMYFRDFPFERGLSSA